MKQPSHILIFSSAYHPYIGGAEVAIKEITDRIPEEEVVFSMITPLFSRALPRTEKIGNITVHRVGVGHSLADKLLIGPLGALKARSIHKHTAVHAGWIMMASYAGWAALIARKVLGVKSPLILTLQEGDSEEYIEKKWFGMIARTWRALLGTVERVSVISNYLAERARHYGYEGESTLIPNGVDYKKFSQVVGREERTKFREAHGLTDEDIVFVTTSRLNIKNGVADVIEALPLLPKKYNFLIAGVGELEDALRRRVEELELRSRVQFLGFVSHSELPLLLQSSDIFIRPSLSEGMGNSFLEAMAANVPVIATQEGGIADFLFDPARDSGCEPTGRAVDPKSPTGIAEQALAYENDPQLTHMITQNAKKLVEERYQWNDIALAMHELFREVV